MKEIADERETDPFETIFAKRGEVQKRSGSKKLVSFALQFHREFSPSVLDGLLLLSLRKVQNF